MDLSDKNHFDNQQYAQYCSFQNNIEWVLIYIEDLQLQTWNCLLWNLYLYWIHIFIWNKKLIKLPFFQIEKISITISSKCLTSLPIHDLCCAIFTQREKIWNVEKNLVVLYILDFFTLSLCDQIWNAAYQ